MNFFKKLSFVYQNYNTKIVSNGRKKEFHIINPAKDENVIILLSHNKLAFCFSYQHAHFDEDINELIKYINLFLSDSYASLEFFNEDEDLFGGTISLKETNLFSAHQLIERFGAIDSYIQNSIDNALLYKCCCWSGLKDVNGMIRKTGNCFSTERL